MNGPAQLVWFKRDLRVHDHEPLTRAAARGPVIALYVYEPSLCTSTEFSVAHFQFVHECLLELREALAIRGCPLLLRTGELPEVLENLYRQIPFAAIWSHEETGLEITYARDRRVAAWARSHNLLWHELRQFGVIRRLQNRDGWSKKWQHQMQQPQHSAPERIATVSSLSDIELQQQRNVLRSASELKVKGSLKPDAVPGGTSHGENFLHSFLAQRGANYRRDMSAPSTSVRACSRLSPYLAWGALSLRQVYQRSSQRRKQLRRHATQRPEASATWLAALHSFTSRLHWHCHFIQKLEDEPRIEFENFSRAHDGLRENSFDAARFAAWCSGHTGYPLVDACMRALHSGGWINFRMRAMLASFAAYHLWLHWRPTAQFLAGHFLDFEPGIHFSQFQMQSGTTGINTIRIYSPIKQALDQDPRGIFIKQHVPELEAVPIQYIAEPHKMPQQLQQTLGVIIGRDYPPPIVDHHTAYRHAQERLFALRKTDTAQQEAHRIQDKHGSRRSGLPQIRQPNRKAAKPTKPMQLALLPDTSRKP
jgi:deoxyribodipyrimidine photo-lyase